MNIYADDTAIYGYIFNSFDIQRLAADLSFNIAQTSQWGKNDCLHFMALKSYLLHSIIVDRTPKCRQSQYPLGEAPWALNTRLTSSGAHTYDPSQKRLSVPLQ